MNDVRSSNTDIVSSDLSSEKKRSLRILIAPMAALGETSGPISRAKALAQEAQRRGHAVAFCAASDGNYQPLAGVQNYAAPLPSPFGLPIWIGRRLLAVTQLLRVQQNKKIRSFEEVLHIVGATNRRFFPGDVQALREAIRAFRADVVYSECRPAAIVAARLEHVPAVTAYGIPLMASYASNPEYSEGVRKFLRANHLPEINSVLDVMDWSQRKIVPSTPELEPIEQPNVVFVGPLQHMEEPAQDIPVAERKKIVIYMGTSAVTPGRLLATVKEAFAATDYDVYIGTKLLEPQESEHLHIAGWFDFHKLLPEAQVYINHGGQNSIVAGLVYGVPQIIFPGPIFERQFNASSVEKIGAGVWQSDDLFTAENLRRLVAQVHDNAEYARNAGVVGAKLLQLGGAPRVIDVLEEEAGKAIKTGQSENLYAQK